MAVTFVAKGTFTAGATALSVGAPAGIADNDLLIIMVAATGAIQDIAGWTAVSADLTSGAIHSRVFYKIASGAQASVTIADVGVQSAIMSAWRGVDTVTPINATTTNADSGLTWEAANPTSTIDGCMLVNCVGFGDGGSSDTLNYFNWANASLVSITEGFDEYNTSGTGIAFAYGIKTLAGAIGKSTAETDSANNYSANTNILLAPIQAGGSFFMFL